MLRPNWLWLVIVALLVCHPACTGESPSPQAPEAAAPSAEVVRHGGQVVLPAHQQGALTGLLDGFSPENGSLVYRAGNIDGTVVRFNLVDRVVGAAERPLARITLAHRSDAKTGERTCVSFVIRTQIFEEMPPVRDAIRAGVDRVIARDKGGFYVVTPPVQVLEQAPSGGPDEPRGPPEEEEGGQGVVLWIPLLIFGLLIFAVIVHVRRSTWSEIVSVHVKKTHLLPTLLQIALFTYWGIHWREFIDGAHFIALELVYAYLLEMILSLLILKHWRVSFGPIPIVLSTNLFVQYTAFGELHMMAIAITVAIASKILIRPGGRHIFNPSGLGLAVIGAIWLLFDGSSTPDTWRVWDLPDGDIAHELNLPPNMAEAIVLLAMIAHLRVPVVLITMSTFVAMVLCGPLYAPLSPAPDWAPIVLVMALLITDPATSPRTPGGQIIFGFTTGLFISTLSWLLESNGVSDFYSKVIPVPVVNALVPTFDRLGRGLTERLRFLSHDFNRWHVAFWICLFFLHSMRGGKGHYFLADVQLHRDNQSRFVKVDGKGEITCESNPLYCSALSLPAEIGCWFEELGDGEGCGNL